MVETVSRGLTPWYLTDTHRNLSIWNPCFPLFLLLDLPNPVSTTLSRKKPLMLRRHKITFPIKVKPEAGFH
jgi:hypothetical protein